MIHTAYWYDLVRIICFSRTLWAVFKPHRGSGRKKVAPLLFGWGSEHAQDYEVQSAALCVEIMIQRDSTYCTMNFNELQWTCGLELVCSTSDPSVFQTCRRKWALNPVIVGCLRYRGTIKGTSPWILTLTPSSMLTQKEARRYGSRTFRKGTTPQHLAVIGLLSFWLMLYSFCRYLCKSIPGIPWSMFLPSDIKHG